MQLNISNECCEIAHYTRVSGGVGAGVRGAVEMHYIPCVGFWAHCIQKPTSGLHLRTGLSIPLILWLGPGSPESGRTNGAHLRTPVEIFLP